MATVERAEALEFVRSSRMAHLATTRPDASPHVVPITFAIIDQGIVTMIDHKPKTTTRLQRLANIEANPAVCVLVDRWSEDWDELRWVRVDGRARVHVDDELWREARLALEAKYTQYRDRPPDGAAIVISIDQVKSWASNA